MNIFSRIKEYIEEKKAPEVNSEEHIYCLHDLIMKEIMFYKDEYESRKKSKLNEKDKFKESVTESILSLINEDERVLRIQEFASHRSADYDRDQRRSNPPPYFHWRQV